MKINLKAWLMLFICICILMGTNRSLHDFFVAEATWNGPSFMRGYEGEDVEHWNLYPRIMTCPKYKNLPGCYTELIDPNWAVNYIIISPDVRIQEFDYAPFYIGKFARLCFWMNMDKIVEAATTPLECCDGNDVYVFKGGCSNRRLVKKDSVAQR